MNVTVIGAGIIGLTSAIRLRESGFETDIVAADLPTRTVASSVAGAIWYPYGSSSSSRAAAWGKHSLGVFTEAAGFGLPGVVLRDMLDLMPESSPEPWWADPERGFRRARPSELRAGYRDGYVQETAVIDVVPHLEYLADRFDRLGGSIAHRRVETLAEEGASDRLVVNCAGVEAGGLARDEGVFPIRGQVVRVCGEPIDRVTIVGRGPLAHAYVMPHGPETLLGGTRQPGEWDRTPSEEITREILDKAVLLEPALAGAEVVEVKVGLRPGRATVRLEHEPMAGIPGIIHNYGHAGNGWSLSWGCAEDVVRIAERLAG